MEKQQSDKFIDPRIGAHISFHCIRGGSGKVFSLPAGGGVEYHYIPESGTADHSHEFGEVVLVLDGEIIHVINGERQELKSGNLLIVRPSDSHYFRPKTNKLCEMVFFDFSLETLLSLSEFLEDDSFMQKFTEPVLPQVFQLSSAETDQLCREFSVIASHTLNFFSAEKIKVKILLAEIFSKFFLDENYILRKQHNLPGWLEALCGEMRKVENFTAGLKRLHELANCTPEHLCKVFRSYLKKTPTEFINELRIAQAARLLAESDEEIFAIAYDLNFNSLSRFYHLFSKYYKVSPARYRRRYRSTLKI